MLPKKLHVRIYLVSVVLILGACQLEPEAISSALEDAPSATPADTPTPTHTPTPTPYTPFLPTTIETEDGLQFIVEYIEIRQTIGSDHAARGYFVALLGTLVNHSGKFHCSQSDEFDLTSGSSTYQMNRDMAELGKRRYGIDYPGFYTGQCILDGDEAPSFLIFDVPENANDLWLRTARYDWRLGDMATLIALSPLGYDSDPPATPTPEIPLIPRKDV